MNKIVVITGASSGIGQALKQKFVEAGDTVYNLSRTNADNDPNFIKCDVTNEQEVISALSTIGDKHGNIDILVNNAGVGISGATELLDSQNVKKVMDVNFYGVFFASKHALKYMKEGAKIINTSSVTAFFATPFRTIYCAAKSAVNMLSYGMRMELAPSRIQVCAICPAETKSNFTANRIKEFETNPRYGDRIKNAAHNIDKNEGKRMSVDMVAGKIYRLICKKRLKPHYIVGAKFHVLKFAQRIASTDCMLKVTGNMFGGKK